MRNHLLSTFRMEHSDSSRTLFAEFRFTPRSIVFANGVAVCDTCTVFVTVTPLPGLYGFTIGPPNLVFSSVGSPVVTFSYGPYGNLSVHDSSTRYPTSVDYALALDIWYERNPGAWEPERNSAPGSGATVSSAVDAPVTHLLAAPR